MKLGRWRARGSSFSDFARSINVLVWLAHGIGANCGVERTFLAKDVREIQRA
jgi:hypothetical protein